MQTFKDSVNGEVYSFEDNVIVTNTNGVYSFKTPDKVPLSSLPTTLQPYTVPSPTTAELLADAQAAQIATLTKDYQAAIYADISFTPTIGTTKAFQADPDSVANLNYMLQAYTPAGAVPNGFYWVAADNSQVPFSLADLQDLAKAMGDRGWTEFQHLQTQKAAVMAATTITDVQAVVW